MTIAVVGTGMAGLSAARALAAAGHAVTVFEKSRGPGGRMATRHVRHVELIGHGSADLSFDHGAQYFTARHPGFVEAVADWRRSRLVIPWAGRVVSFDDEGWEDVAPGTDRFVGVPGMSAVAKHLAQGLDIRYEVRIESLDDVREFDRCVVAVPAPQAAAIVASIPALAERAKAVAMRPCWAVLAAFDEPVATRFDAAFVSGSPLAWVARNQSKPRRGTLETWVLHASTSWSAAHVDDQPDTVGPFLLDAFHDLVPAGVPKPFYLDAHRWRYAMADPPLAAGAIADDRGRVVLCGDWCAGPRIEDAWLSGLAAADRVLGLRS